MCSDAGGKSKRRSVIAHQSESIQRIGSSCSRNSKSPRNLFFLFSDGANVSSVRESVFASADCDKGVLRIAVSNGG